MTKRPSTSTPVAGNRPAQRALVADRRGIHPTKREIAVLSGVVRGDSNAEIARALRIQEQTVKNHVSVLLGKFHVRNRVQLAVHIARLWPHLLSADR